MARFDFIGDPEFRKSLESDYAEVNSCFAAKSWKAVHVLVGSIVEAVLVDYFVTSGRKVRKNPLQMTLGELIRACHQEGILSQKTLELSATIKSYRNLVHPGRQVRLGEVVDENSSIVTKALMHMVFDEVSAWRKKEYGYTAEQIVAKLERDPSSLAILNHILRETKEHERGRLLLDVIPARYMEIESERGSTSLFGVEDVEYVQALTETQTRLSHCFRTCFDMIPNKTKKKVMNKFISILRTENQETVFTYETAFVRGTDLGFISKNDLPLAKDHLLSRLGKGFDNSIVRMLEGVEKFLDPGDAEKWVDPLVQSIAYEHDEGVGKVSRKYLEEAYWKVEDHDFEDKVTARLDDWIKHLEEKGREDVVAILRGIKSSWERPF